MEVIELLNATQTKVVCISGKAQHGKDTTARMMRDVLESDGYRVLVAHYADLVKYICRQFFDWNGEKDERGRTLLQYVGTDIVRKQRPDYWVDFLISVLQMFRGQWDYVLIPDCRFPNEIDRLYEAGFYPFHVRVVRPNFVSPLTPEQQAHPSETSLDDFRVDMYINNDGTLKDLYETVEKRTRKRVAYFNRGVNE